MEDLRKLQKVHEPDLSELLDNLKTNIFRSMNCVNIGIIQSFDSNTQTATIQLAIKKVAEIREDGTKVIVERPILLKVPVITLFGGASFISLGIKQGDECIVFFNDRDIENWYLTGSPQSPKTKRAHDITDGIALVGVKSLNNAIQNFLETGIRLSHTGAQIDLTQDQIDSISQQWTHEGNMFVDGNFTVSGTMRGYDGNPLTLDSDVVQDNSYTFSAGNGATGTFDVVTVVDGIVTGGS